MGTSASLPNGGRITPVTSLGSTIYTLPGVIGTAQAASALLANTDYYFPIYAETGLTFDRLALEVTTAGTAGGTARIALITAGRDWQPTALVEDFGTTLIDTLGSKTLTPAGGARTINTGLYLLALNLSVAASFQALRGCVPSSPLVAGTSMFARALSVARVHGAYPSPPLAWTAVGAGAVPAGHPVLLRVTA